MQQRYFDRLETVPFFNLFTREGDMKYKSCGNTGHRGLKARVLDCYVAQISSRKGAGEHVLHSDGSLKGLVTPS